MTLEIFEELLALGVKCSESIQTKDGFTYTMDYSKCKNKKRVLELIGK